MEGVIDFLEIEEKDLQNVIEDVRDYSKDHYSSVDIFNGIKAPLQKLEKGEYSLSIVSSNTEEVVENFLDEYGIRRAFNRIYTTKGLFDKGGIINKISDEEGLEKGEILLISDERRDIKTGNEKGVETAAVCWGYDSKDVLEKCEWEYLLEGPKDLKEVIKLIS